MPELTRVLVTGAGGPAGMGTIRSLLQTPGLTVVAADMNPLAPGLYWTKERSILPSAGDPEFVPSLLKTCARFKVDVLFPTVDEEISVIAENEERLRSKVAFLIGDRQGVEACNDKWQTYSWLRKAGIPVVETIRIRDKEALRRGSSRLGFPVAIKPRASRGGRGLHICGETAELERAYSELTATLPFKDAYLGVPEASDIVMQEFLPGTEYDAIVLLDKHGKQLGNVPMKARRWNVTEHTREIVTVHDREVEDLSAKTVRSLGLECPVDVEMARDREERLKILDVNPRVGGDVDLATAAGCNIPLMYVTECLGDRVHSKGFKEGVILVRYTGIQVIQPEEIPRRERRKR